MHTVWQGVSGCDLRYACTCVHTIDSHYLTEKKGCAYQDSAIKIHNVAILLWCVCMCGHARVWWSIFFLNFFSGPNQAYLNGGLIRTRDVNVSLSSYYTFPTYVSFEWMWAFSMCVTGRSLIRPSLTTQVTFEELLMDVFGTQPSYPLSPFPPSLCAFPCFNLRLD